MKDTVFWDAMPTDVSQECAATAVRTLNMKAAGPFWNVCT